MISLLLGTALAQDIPAKPEPRPPVENQCEEATSVAEPCAAVAIPTSEAADMLDIEVWGDELYAHYDASLLAWKLEEESYQNEVQALRRSVWVRAAEGLLIGFAAGYLTYSILDE